MLRIKRRAYRQLEKALFAAEDNLPALVKAIVDEIVLTRTLTPYCGDDESCLGWWDSEKQELGFNGPLIVDLSPPALYALVCHEAAHIYLFFRNMDGRNEEEVADDLSSKWGADVAALHEETGRGVGPVEC